MEKETNTKKILLIVIISLTTFICGLLCSDVMAGNNIFEGKSIRKGSEILVSDKQLEKNDNEKDATNPIDEYYLLKYDSKLSTYELLEISDNHFTAWKNEFENVVSLLKDNYSFYEDKEYFDNYLKKYEDLATLSAEIEYLKWVDTTIEPKDRLSGTGASYSTAISMIDIYRQGCLNLIKAYENNNQDKKIEYSYIFNK